jgi:hypothetical protein
MRRLAVIPPGATLHDERPRPQRRRPRVLGRARITITLDIYTHLFEDARHARDIRTRMAASPFAGLLEPTTAPPSATVLKLR